MMDRIVFTTASELEELILACLGKFLLENSNMSRSDKTDILNITEASAYLKLAKQTIYGFTSRNEIPFIKRGKKLYFRKADLEIWLLKGKRLTREEIEKEGIPKILLSHKGSRH